MQNKEKVNLFSSERKEHWKEQRLLRQPYIGSDFYQDAQIYKTAADLVWKEVESSFAYLMREEEKYNQKKVVQTKSRNMSKEEESYFKKQMLGGVWKMLAGFTLELALKAIIYNRSKEKIINDAGRLKVFWKDGHDLMELIKLTKIDFKLHPRDKDFLISASYYIRHGKYPLSIDYKKSIPQKLPRGGYNLIKFVGSWENGNFRNLYECFKKELSEK